MAEIEYDIFLSYNKAQKDWTRKLATRLRKEGFQVWFDDWCIRPGENIQLAIEQGILNSDRIALILSPEAMRSDWVTFEQLMTTLPDPVNRTRTLIPMYRITCEIPRRIAGFSYIDFRRDDNFEEAFIALVRELRGEPPGATETPKRLGDLPRAFVMPHLPNPNFVGREVEIEELHRSLSAGVTVAVGQVAAATGLGGIGKTQLAIAYVYRYGGHYPGGVYWIDAENPDAILEQVAVFGGPMGLDLPEFATMNLETKVEKVRAAWRRVVTRLIIFDNVTEPEVIREWCPQGGGGKVLVTSRREDWPSWLDVRPLSLSPLPRDEAIDLLLRGGPRATEETEASIAIASEICEVLGDLPLAVDLAGKYLSAYKHAISLEKYLEDLKAQPVLQNSALVGDVCDPSPTKHLQNVAATFEMSWERLDAQDTTDLTAMQFFHLAGFFAVYSINSDLLMSANEMDPRQDKDRIRATKAFRHLASLGLLTIEVDGRLMQHRLLAAFARTRPGPGQTPREALKDVCWEVAAFAENANENVLVADLAKELPHLRHLAKKAVEEDLTVVDARLQFELGHHLHLQAAYEEAHKHIDKAVEIEMRYLVSCLKSFVLNNGKLKY